MDAVRGQGMYPLHRCKTIHLVDTWYYPPLAVLIKISFGLKRERLIWMHVTFLHVGETCPGIPQCGWRKGPQCIHVPWAFWCSTNPSWLATGENWPHIILLCVIWIQVLNSSVYFQYLFSKQIGKIFFKWETV